MGGILWLFLSGHAHDLRLALLRDDRFHSPSRSIVLDALASGFQETVPPAPDRVVAHLKTTCGWPDPGPIREQQKNPGTFDYPRRKRLAPAPGFKLSAILRRHLQGIGFPHGILHSLKCRGDKGGSDTQNAKPRPDQGRGRWSPTGLHAERPAPLAARSVAARPAIAGRAWAVWVAAPNREENSA